ncbi:MAG: DEAD/DEAH box helicase [Desulfovibrio sp. MES5]|uniref:DEAD/DEAH box helicase n=1 Tax=Desulfovibrio sp. MES5 TaxID=1899016 RepID=UPI000B9CBC2C|nr:DEAD/DEAH box helicase [Desulfovibrio sp. MES5]OXS30011.1 MAG: DEAD/DEAH box helicase [Desulfovibrio sp. MES5]
MSVGSYIAALLASEKLGGQVTCHRLLPAAEPQYAQTRLPWPTAISRTLEQRGIPGLYSHQALATDHIRAGHSIVAATPTASGKSLIYNLPVLERHLRDPDARALYLFPLKALAQDQLAAFNALTATWPKDARPAAALYDGDTTDHFRRKIRRDPPAVLISNPEMLHLGILPHHEQWAAFLAGLTHVVVDEAHTYRGVFGAHMAQVFRRLNRLAGRYGAKPVYVLCTATVGNPGELGAALTGTAYPVAEENIASGGTGSGSAFSATGNIVSGTATAPVFQTVNPATPPPVVIDKSGAPQGPRHFVFLNPEQSPATAAIDLLKAALARNLRTIVYCRSRRMTELISLWAGQSGSFASRISAYRAGFLPEERRSIESRMASGDLLAVVSTSALELGIDIGGLDVCILVGYPGTVMATLQRGGRVGRAQQESAVIIVAGEDALDQYFARNPEDFFSRPPEKAVVNPDNEVILARHLECAAAEMPLRPGEPMLASAAALTAARQLNAQGLLLQSADGSQLMASRKRPQRHVDLRGTGQTFSIEDEQGHIIGSVDGFRAWRETHPGAVYLHRGRSYIIDDMDPARARIMAKEAKVGWFTRTRGQKATDILEETARMSLGRVLVCRGRLRIIDTVTGYEKRSTSGNRLLTITPLEAPPQVFETEGLWFVIPDNIRAEMEDNFMHFMGGIHALEHAAIGMLPLLIMADRNDFGGISTPMHAQLGLPAVFIYDGLPGGAGLTRQAFGDARALLEATYKTVAACPCEDGCPSCVHSPKCGSGNRPIDKRAALELLRQLLTPGTEGDTLHEKLVISPPPPRPELEFVAAGVTTAAQSRPDTVASPHNAPAPAAHASLSVPTGSPAPASSAAFAPADNSADNLAGGPAETPSVRANSTVPPAAGLGARPAPASTQGGSPMTDLMGYISLPPPEHFVVFDVETRRSAAEVGGWHKAGDMGVSVAVAYDSRADDFFSYTQDELPALFERMRASGLVVGFNSLRFDYAVLAPFAPFDLRGLPSLDILQRIKDRLNYLISLDNLGQATLEAPKSADGLQALRWWKEGKMDEIAAYCRMDVDLTRRLYLYGLEHGHLLFTNKAGARVRVPVDLRPPQSSLRME